MAYRNRWDAYFDLLDVDGSGFLSGDDIAGGVAVNFIIINKYLIILI